MIKKEDLKVGAEFLNSYSDKVKIIAISKNFLIIEEINGSERAVIIDYAIRTYSYIPVERKNIELRPYLVNGVLWYLTDDKKRLYEGRGKTTLKGMSDSYDIRPFPHLPSIFIWEDTLETAEV